MCTFVLVVKKFIEAMDHDNNQIPQITTMKMGLTATTFGIFHFLN